jgi:hypothetical protein
LSPSLNVQVAGSTSKESNKRYYDKKRAQILQHQKELHKNKATQFRLISKEYYKNNKERILRTKKQIRDETKFSQSMDGLNKILSE